MRKIAAALALLVVSACSSTGSGSRPANVPEPQVVVRQIGPIFFGSSTSTSVALEITVSNPGDLPLKLRRAQLETPTMGQFSMRASRIYNQTIEPHSSRTFAIQGMAETNRSRLDPTEPLTVRAIIDFESGMQKFREISIQNPPTGYR